MSDDKPKRPPSDRGQGRKPTPPEEKLIGKSVRMTVSQWIKFDELGGGEWLRAAVEAAKPCSFRKKPVPK